MKTVVSLLLFVFTLSIVVSAASDKTLYHDIKISQLIITEQSLHCSKEVLVMVDIENEGTFTEDVYVELMNKPLDIHAFSPSTKVYARSREQILLPLYFDQEPQGTYTFDAYFYTGRNIQPSFHTFTFSGCKTVQLTSYIQDTPPQKTFLSSSPAHEQPMDFLLISTLFIVACLVLI